MTAKLIKFSYTDSDLNPEGSRTRNKTGIAILLEYGTKKVVATQRPSGMEFFEMVGRDDRNQFKYKPFDLSAILPEKDYEMVEQLEIKDDDVALMMGLPALFQRIHEVKRMSLDIVAQARSKIPGLY